MIPTRVTNLEKARRLYGSRADYYTSFLLKGDPLADAVVDEFEKLPRGEGHRLFEQALDHGIQSVTNAPPALQALFEQVDHVPDWVDWRQLRLGARTYQRTGIGGSLVLSALSLMNGYHSAAASKALVLTGRLDKMARRRLAETGRFIVETVQVDGLRRYRAGFKISLKVRLIHAHIRKALAKHEAWDAEAWGTPINNADMAATTLTFSVAMIYGTRMMGWRYTTEEADALMALWRYSGYLSGVDAGLLCCSESEAMNWSEMIDMLQPGPDESSIALAKALRDVNIERPENWFEKALNPFLVAYHDGLTRWTAGDEVADDLQIPNYLWKYAIPATRLVREPMERLRELVPGGTLMSSLLGNYLLRTAVSRELKGVSANFRPPAKPVQAVDRNLRVAS